MCAWGCSWLGLGLPLSCVPGHPVEAACSAQGSGEAEQCRLLQGCGQGAVVPGQLQAACISVAGVRRPPLMEAASEVEGLTAVGPALGVLESFQSTWVSRGPAQLQAMCAA